MKTNFYKEIAKNKVLSVFLLFFLFVIVALVLYIVGWFYDPALIPAFLLVGGAIVIIQALASYYYGDKIILKISKAIPADRKKFRRLHNIVEGLAIAAGIPKPKVYILPNLEINAFATGRDPEHASIAVTLGALERLNKEELEGVIAHEISHIVNYDILFQTIVAVTVGLISIIAHFFVRSFFFSRGRKDKDDAIFLIIGLLFMLLAPLSATLIRLAISRRREFLADANGAKLTRYPEGLASALEKIAKDEIKDIKTSDAIAPLFIAEPFRRKLSALFATHPPIEERIKRLRAME